MHHHHPTDTPTCPAGVFDRPSRFDDAALAALRALPRQVSDRIDAYDIDVDGDGDGGALILVHHPRFDPDDPRNDTVMRFGASHLARTRIEFTIPQP